MQETSEYGEQNVSVAKMGFTILRTEKKQGSSKNVRSFNSDGSVNATTRNSMGMVWILHITHITVYIIRQGGHLSFS
jgi:hypothetical protein